MVLVCSAKQLEAHRQIALTCVVYTQWRQFELGAPSAATLIPLVGIHLLDDAPYMIETGRQLSPEFSTGKYLSPPNSYFLMHARPPSGFLYLNSYQVRCHAPDPYPP